MCGIAGILGTIQSEHVLALEKMSTAIKHRGPDAKGTYSDDHVALAHRRLSIIDLNPRSNQPFSVRDLPYVIVFNGEIYNYKSLQSALHQTFETDSDTEVILRAYHAWGPDCVKQFNGMFAFAIYNTNDHSLFVARDPLGIKPLYYACSNGLFIFASELRAVLSSGLIPRQLNHQALSSFLSYGFVPEPYTMMQGVLQIPSAHAGFVNATDVHLLPYWSPQGASNDQAQLKPLKPILEQAVAQRMVSDVPVAAFLSGGIDSSAVVALMRSYSVNQFSTYSVALDNQALDESEYAQRLADKYHTEHHNVLVKSEEVLNAFEGFFNAMDTPTVDGMNVYLITQAVAKQGVRVVMSGVGGDELFAGYPGFKQWHTLKPFYKWIKFLKIHWVLKGLSKLFNHNGLSQLNFWLGQSDAHSVKAFYAAKRRLFDASRLNNIAANLPASYKLNPRTFKDAQSTCSDYSLMELTNYTREVLMKDMDQMGMAFGVEIREPFLDVHLLEAAFQYDDQSKLSRSMNKPLLVKAMGDFMLNGSLNRKKQGFTLDWDHWLRHDLNPLLQTAIQELARTQLFKASALNQLYQSYMNKDAKVNWLHMWSLVVLHQWFKRHLTDLFNH